MAILAALASTPAGFGGFTFGVLLASVVAMVAEFGSGAVVTREGSLGHDPARLAAFVTSRLATLYGLAIIAFALVALVVDFQRLICLAAGIGLTMAGNSITAAYLLSVGRGGRAGASNTAFNLTGAGFLLALMLINGDRWPAGWLLASYAAGSAIAAVVGLSGLASMDAFRAAQLKPLRWRSPDRPLAMRAGSVQTLVLLGTYVDQFVLTTSKDLAALGQYGLASRFKDVATAIPGILTMAFQPYFTIGMHGEHADRFYRRSLCWMVVLCCSLGAAVALLGPLAIHAFLPQRYAPSVDLMVILAAGLYGGALHTTALFVVRGLAGERLQTGAVAFIYAWPLALVGVGSLVVIRLADVQALALVRAGMDVLGYTWVVAAISNRAGIALPRIVWPLTGLGALGVLAAFRYPDTLVAPLAIAAPALLAAAALFFDRARASQGG